MASLNVGYSYYNHTNSDHQKYRTDVTNYLSKYKTVVDLLSSIDINEYLP
jgi:hypothetical protein